MKKVIIGRPINDISLNGLEYILDDEGEIRYFDSIDEAKALLREHGYDDEDMEDYLVFKESEDRTCFRCGSPLFKSDIAGYTYQCFHCDEDFYAFEQEDRLDTLKDEIAGMAQVPRNILFAEGDQNGE